MPYQNVKKVNGPYKSKKDGRERIILFFLNGLQRTVSYPKYLMENHLNRFLLENETVDHIDGNFHNNDISNLQVLNRQDHVVQDAIRNLDVKVNCSYCNKLFIIRGSKLHQRNRKDRNSSGYFCSRSCSGKYGVEIQKGKRNHIKVNKVIPTKISLKNLST